jgi:hypothetical protein
MCPKGLSWIALTGLMVLGATAAEAGVSCKIVPSWCPAGDGARDIRSGNARTGAASSNKGVGNASTSAGSGDVAASAAGVATGTTGAAGSTVAVTNGTTIVAASTPGVTSSATDVAAAAASVTASTDSVTGKTTSVPEPASLFLLGAGVSAVGAAMRRRRKGP